MITPRPRDPARRRVVSFLLAAGLAAGAVPALTASPASAASVCDPGTDVCGVVPDTVQTPLGPVTVAVSPANVVTVRLTPAGAGRTAEPARTAGPGDRLRSPA